jgi:ATP-binding cassette subfamily F protein uup
MALITLKEVSWGLGDAPLIENASLQIEEGEQTSLMGRNGVGKSTLLKLLTGSLLPDKGDIWRQKGLDIAVLDQQIPLETQGTVYEVVAGGAGPPGVVLAEYHQLSRHPETGLTPDISKRLHILRDQLNAEEGWGLARQVDRALSQIGLDPDLEFKHLSAGMKRRALFCRTMVRQPDLLLLDEPTNHLDIDTIVWMEEYIRRHVKTVLFVSHDRAFAQRIANRIVLLDRGRLTAYNCGYTTYLKRRQADEHSEKNRQRRFDKELSREEAWIRQGIKARRTRNQGRVRALLKLRQKYRRRRRNIGNVQLKVQHGQRSGKLVIEVDGVTYAYEETTYIKDLSTLIMRGDKIGLIGPNGIGKSTLIKILLKKISPDRGKVRHGTKLQVAYFDQLRRQLDENRTVVENIGDGNDFVVFNNAKRHVISYLQDFLFPPDRCRTPVHILSGGEKNRLLLAKLFAKPANVLVLDEPTNDLDVETLELLEELLLDYTGTLLLVSHDRAFLNNVVTGTFAFEGDGVIRQYPGGYDDWLDQRPSQPKDNVDDGKGKKVRRPSPESAISKKLGYMEQRELEALPQLIEDLEAEQQHLFATVSNPDFYKKPKSEITCLKARLETVEADLATAYERWQDLESRGT